MMNRSGENNPDLSSRVGKSSWLLFHKNIMLYMSEQSPVHARSSGGGEG